MSNGVPSSIAFTSARATAAKSDKTDLVYFILFTLRNHLRSSHRQAPEKDSFAAQRIRVSRDPREQ